MRLLVARFRRILAIAAGAALAVLHIGILWRRVVDGSLLRPLVVAQWAVAAALVLAVLVLRRRGVSVFRGRSGAAFWVVVALMHAIVALPGGPGFVGVLNSTPVTAALPVGLGLIAVALVILAGRPTVKSRPTLRRFDLFRAASPLAASAGLPSALAPRAPPA